jgi:hypothetical protein
VRDTESLSEVIGLPEAILLAGPGLGKTNAYRLAKLGTFPGQLPSVRGRYRISRARLVEALAAGWTEDEQDGAA